MAFTYFVKINGNDLPKLKAYKVQRNKLTTDAGRNLSGALKFTSLGIYPKLFLEFTHTTQTEMSTLINLLDLSSFNVAWYDEKSQTIKTGTYYASDYEYSVFSKIRELYEPFTVNLIPFSRYT